MSSPDGDAVPSTKVRSRASRFMPGVSAGTPARRAASATESDPDAGLQLDVGRVDAVLRGLEQADRAVRAVAVVGERVAVDRGRASRRSRSTSRGHVLLGGGRQRERLEGRSGLGERRRGVVDLVVDEVLAAIDGDDLAGAGAHGGQPDAQALGAALGPCLRTAAVAAFCACRSNVEVIRRPPRWISVSSKPRSMSCSSTMVSMKPICPPSRSFALTFLILGNCAFAALLGREPALLDHRVEHVLPAPLAGAGRSLLGARPLGDLMIDASTAPCSALSSLDGIPK